MLPSIIIYGYPYDVALAVLGIPTELLLCANLQSKKNDQHISKHLWSTAIKWGWLVALCSGGSCYFSILPAAHKGGFFSSFTFFVGFV
jgi:hypothetical protein